MNRQIQYLYYLVLTAILVSGVGIFSALKGNQAGQFFVGTTTAAAYSIWGISYHWLRQDLHRKIVVEYVLIGLIAVLLLATVMYT
jgi:hypothetical protein